MPFCTIDIAVVGPKGQFAIALFFPTGEDVATIGWCQSVALVFVCSPKYINFASFSLLSGITGCEAIKCKADSIEQCGFT